MASWTQLRRYLRLAMVIVVMVTIAGCMRTEVAPPVEQPGQGQPPSESEEGPLGTLVQMSDGPGSARAWVELMPKIVLGEDPLGVYEVRFHAQADATVEIVIPEVILEVGHDSLVTWLSDGRVLFANPLCQDGGDS